MDYVAVTDEERREMLATIGVDSIDDLFSVIPERCRFSGDLAIPPAASELDLQRELTAIAGENDGAHTHACFMGAGSYDHFIPTLIDQMISRGEFLTAYTPYQAEASQGSLQAFFEFQTQIARLTGMDVANASMYEGASATAEATKMAINVTGGKRILVAATLHPDYRQTLDTVIGEWSGVEMVEIPANENGGRIDPKTIKQNLTEDTACVIVQSPNFFGVIEDWQACFDAAHTGKKTLAVAVFNPIACALLKKPGECGADIAVGEGQSLGTPMQLGGPYLGLFATKKALTRKMPGRLVGRTVDRDGRPAYCLVLQTREQHIRRDKATSNICTNQGLLALRATMFLNALGPKGLAEMAQQCWHKAHYAASAIANIPGFSVKYSEPSNEIQFFHEFVIVGPCHANEIIEQAVEVGLMIGPSLDSPAAGAVGKASELLVCVTEKRTREELDSLVEFLNGFSA